MNSFPVPRIHSSHSREKGVVKWAFGIALSGEETINTIWERLPRNSAVRSPRATVASISSVTTTYDSSTSIRVDLQDCAQEKDDENNPPHLMQCFEKYQNLVWHGKRWNEGKVHAHSHDRV